MVIVGSRVGMYIRTCMRSPDVIVAIRACFLLIQSNTSREALSSQRAPFLPLASPHLSNYYPAISSYDSRFCTRSGEI